jgi:hypothetical protein
LNELSELNEREHQELTESLDFKEVKDLKNLNITVDMKELIAMIDIDMMIDTTDISHDIERIMTTQVASHKLQFVEIQTKNIPLSCISIYYTSCI